VIALVLTVLISLIILVALFRLSASVLGSLLLGALDPLDPRAFQAVFGEILTLLIALEFNHTVQYVASHRSIIQTKVVLLIALLALARKFVILDTQELSAGHLLGLAAITLVLGVTYWLLRERDDRLGARRESDRGAQT
jgi:uncharacterized membrane protein (DUF373 family)